MAALDDLKTYYIAETAKLIDTLDKLECLRLIDQWYLAEQALDVALSTDVASYTDPSGVSATRRATSAQALTAMTLRRDILNYLRARGSILIDNRFAWLDGRYTGAATI